jgi:hypothetical protein
MSTDKASQPHIRSRRRALVVLLAGAVAAVASGCGTTSVSMLVVRPALINAQSFGGSASVAGFVASRGEWAAYAEPMRADVERFLLAGHGGVVRVMQQGGGLVISGQIDELGLRTRNEVEDTTCEDKVKVKQGGREVESVVKRDCKRVRTQWEAIVSVRTRVTSSAGQLVYLRHVSRNKTGVTAWANDEPPVLPVATVNRHLDRLRLDVARDIAWLVVPHKVRVTATLYDCPEPAKRVCEDGARLLAASNYDGALGAYATALERLGKAAKVERSTLAEVHWNRAIVAKYGRRFELAIAELQAAIALDDSSSYRRELGAVRGAAEDHERLIDQGLGGSAP